MRGRGCVAGRMGTERGETVRTLWIRPRGFVRTMNEADRSDLRPRRGAPFSSFCPDL